MVKKIATTTLTFAAGATVGAISGVLLAPRKGTITRAKLKNALDEKKEQAEEEAMMLRQKAKDANKMAKKKLQSFSGN